MGPAKFVDWHGAWIGDMKYALELERRKDRVNDIEVGYSISIEKGF